MTRFRERPPLTISRFLTYFFILFFLVGNQITQRERPKQNKKQETVSRLMQKAPKLETLKGFTPGHLATVGRRALGGSLRSFSFFELPIEADTGKFSV